MPEPTMLTTLTTIINLLALALSLWLGFYVLTRSPHSTISRLAALMLWSFDTYFLSNALWNNVQTNVVLAWLLQLALLALPLMLHLTVRWLPEPRSAHSAKSLLVVNRVSVPLAYVIAIVLIAGGVLPSSPPVGLFNASPARPETAPLGFVSKTYSPAYPLFVIYLLLVSALALVNLWNASQQTRGTPLASSFTTFFVAAALASAGATYSGLATWLRLDVPTLPADILYAAAILLVGYAVARYSALLEGRPIERDFLNTFLVVGSFTALYVLIALALYLGGQISFVALVLTLIGTIAGHSMLDGVRIALDRVIYQSQFQRLRGNLRALAREAGTGGTLSERLGAVLTSLCRVFRIQRGFIALCDHDQWVIQATHDANPVGHTLESAVLRASESIGLVHSEKKDLWGMKLLIPLFAGGSQIGALVLGSKESQESYGEADLELLEDLADQISGLIHALQLQDENARTIDRMVQDFREKERTLQRQTQEIVAVSRETGRPVEASSVETLLPLVEDALRKLYDLAYLGDHPLAKLAMVEQRLQERGEPGAGFIERGKVVSEVLVQALNELQPNGTPPGENQVPPRDWHAFIILHDSYVSDTPNRDIMSRLYISQGTFNRTRRRALRSVAQTLVESERSASAEQRSSYVHTTRS
jgi:hypothetical protein